VVDDNLLNVLDDDPPASAQYMLLDAGLYVQDVFVYVDLDVETVVVAEEAVQDPQVVVVVVVEDEVELGSDQESQLVVSEVPVVLAAGSVDVAEPQLQTLPSAEIVPAWLPSPPIGGAAMEEWAQPVVKGKAVVEEPAYVTPVGSLPQFDQVEPAAVAVDEVPVVAVV
jgi:hypothetical protein